MRASFCTKYGGPEVLKIIKIEKPTPKENEIRIRICAASVTMADTMMREGKPYIGRLFLGILKPKNKITGTGFSGVVEAIGSKVGLFKIGDAVFGESVFGQGTNAEFICVKEDGILLQKPNSISHLEAASICDGALTSINFLKSLAEISAGQKILINGASGSLGTAAIQLAKYYGAEITGVCSAKNRNLVKLLGADKVLDYNKENFTNNKETYDVVYDTVGKSSFLKCKKILKKEGIYMSPVLSLSLLFQMILTSLLGTKKAKFSATGTLSILELRKFLMELKEIIEEGKLKSVIDKTYALEEIVEAHAYVDTGHKTGNVVVFI